MTFGFVYFRGNIPLAQFRSFKFSSTAKSKISNSEFLNSEISNSKVSKSEVSDSVRGQKWNDGGGEGQVEFWSKHL